MDTFDRLIIKHSGMARIVAALFILLAFDHFISFDYDSALKEWEWNWGNIWHNLVVLYKSMIYLIYILGVILGGMTFIVIHDNKKQQ